MQRTSRQYRPIYHYQLRLIGYNDASECVGFNVPLDVVQWRGGDTTTLSTTGMRITLATCWWHFKVYTDQRINYF